VIASGLAPSDRVVTTGFANLSDGAKVLIGKDEQTPSADLAPRKKRSSREVPSTDSPGKDGKKGEGDQKGRAGPGQGSQQSGSGAKSQP